MMVFKVRHDPKLFEKLLPQLLAYVVARESAIRPAAVTRQLRSENRALLDGWHETHVCLVARDLHTPLVRTLAAVALHDAGSAAARASLEGCATETEVEVGRACRGTACGFRRSRADHPTGAAPTVLVAAAAVPPVAGAPAPVVRPSAPPAHPSVAWNRQWADAEVLAEARRQALQVALDAATAQQPAVAAGATIQRSPEWQAFLAAQAAALHRNQFSDDDVARLASPLSTPWLLRSEDVWQHVAPLLEARVSLLLLELRKNTPRGTVVRMLVHLDALVGYFARCSRLPICILSSWTKVTSDPTGDIYCETARGRGGKLYASADSIHGQALDAGACALGETSRHDFNALDMCPFTDAPASEDNPHTEPGKGLLECAMQLFAKHVLPLLLQLQPLLLVQQEACCRYLLAAVRGNTATYRICNVREATEPLLAEHLGEHLDGDDEGPRLEGDRCGLNLGCFASEKSKACTGLFGIKLLTPPLTGLPTASWLLTSYSWGAKLSCRMHTATPDGLFAYASTVSTQLDIIRSLIVGEYVQPAPLDDTNPLFQFVVRMTGATPSEDFSRSRVAGGLTPSVAGGRRSARLRGALAVRLGLNESDLDFQSLLRIACLCLCKFTIRSGGAHPDYEDWASVCAAFPPLGEAAAAESGRRRTTLALRRLSVSQLVQLGYDNLPAAETALGSFATTNEMQQRVRALVPPPACDSALAGQLAATFSCTPQQAASLMRSCGNAKLSDPAFCTSLDRLASALGLTTVWTR